MGGDKYGIVKSGIAVDIDETLSDTIGHLAQGLMEKFGNPENLTIKEIIEKYRYTYHVPYWQSPEALAWVKRNIDSNELQKELPLIEGADLYLKKIDKIIPIAAYITVRPELVLEGTRQWLEKHNFPMAPIICKPNNIIHSDGNEWKAGVLEDLYPEILGIIDDNPKLLKFLPADYQGQVFLYDHHDNLGQANVIACKTWAEVYQNIKNIFSNFK